jgi:hypothetical protein
MIFLEAFKRSEGHVLPLRGADGRLLWTAIHDDKYKNG